ncbi:MAG: DUF1192 domain-containing protein [Alphaproteobacteria bacterium]|nr:DUF1192 domain-containing protein [Alphaproteobacteria bacterium]
MARDDDDPFARPKKKAVHEIGEVLDAISVEELGERIALLREEITRLEEAMKAKQASKAAADVFFKS